MQYICALRANHVPSSSTSIHTLLPVLRHVSQQTRSQTYAARILVNIFTTSSASTLMADRDAMAHQTRQRTMHRMLPFDQMLARLSLASINPGPDGVLSMSQCQCNTEVYEVREHHVWVCSEPCDGQNIDTPSGFTTTSSCSSQTRVRQAVPPLSSLSRRRYAKKSSPTL